MRQRRDRSYRPAVRFHSGTNEYQVRVRRRNWWWLLLLLLLLLLVRCERTIEVTTVDALTSEGVEDVNVSLAYKAHYLFKDGKFFASEMISEEQQTDSEGMAVFEKLPCSVFSYIFYTLSPVYIAADSPCYKSAQATRLFHWCYTQNFRLERLLTDLIITVVDKETEEPLVNATVECLYNTSGAMVTEKTTTDANGRVHISDFWECGVISEMRASCYGYADTLRTDVPARLLKEIGPSSTLKLRPLKLSFDFFVHNVETREPIPMALATVTLTNPDKRSTRGTTKTNVDGKGRGFYDDAFVLATVGIEASKQHYYDSILVGEYTVEQFVNLPREQRTVWLRPKPYMVAFENVDSITGDPIPGVTNKITVTEPSGEVESNVEMSNTNGKFYITAKEGAKVEIISSKDEDYKTKTTSIASFSEGEKIPMSPDVITCNADIVFCIDNSMSMWAMLEVVKNNAMSFHQDLTRCCLKHKRQIEQMRLKVLVFGDLFEIPIETSRMFDMPSEQSDFNSYVRNIKYSVGYDPDEDGLEALATAIKDTKWNPSKERTRHIIILYSDACCHPLYPTSSKKYRRDDMPNSMEELTALWEGMNPVARRLVLFTPTATYWNDISSSWDGVFHRQFDTSFEYDDILEAICKSL